MSGIWQKGQHLFTLWLHFNWPTRSLSHLVNPLPPPQMSQRDWDHFWRILLWIEKIELKRLLELSNLIRPRFQATLPVVFCQGQRRGNGKWERWWQQWSREVPSHQAPQVSRALKKARLGFLDYEGRRIITVQELLLLHRTSLEVFSSEMITAR